LKLITLADLQVGMEVGQDIYDEHNRLLLGRGAAVKGPYISRLKKMGLPPCMYRTMTPKTSLQ
jgi:hypothetical protein